MFTQDTIAEKEYDNNDKDADRQVLKLIINETFYII